MTVNSLPAMLRLLLGMEGAVEVEGELEIVRGGDPEDDGEGMEAAEGEGEEDIQWEVEDDGGVLDAFRDRNNGDAAGRD